MKHALRRVVPSVAIAFLLALLLAAWIRTQPVGMPRALQLTLTVGLVLAVAGTVARIWDTEM
jgi:hypothetical protein